MLLANVAELVQIDIGPVAGYLTISVRNLSCLAIYDSADYVLQYFFSPLMAFVCTLAVLVVQAAGQRTKFG